MAVPDWLGRRRLLGERGGGEGGAEETGIIAEPVSIIAVLDGLRLGFTAVPLYSVVFYCRSLGGTLAAHPLETSDVGWFSEDNLPNPVVGYDRWGPAAFAAIRGEP